MTVASLGAPTRGFRRLPTTLFVVALILGLLFIDSQWMASRVPHTQWIANACMIAAFVVIYRDAPPRLRHLMKYGVVVATVGEVVFSLLLGMYEYRLENVPVYVPPGHSIVYAAVYYFVHEPFVLRKQRLICMVMLLLSVTYASLCLAYDHDVYGMVCTLGFLAVIAWRPDSRLFFLTMFLFVAYLEQVGTRFGCWYWHPTLLDRFAFMPSGNPPSGISIFYFGFDLGCLLAYMRRNPAIAARWRRLRARSARHAAGGTPGFAPAE